MTARRLWNFAREFKVRFPARFEFLQALSMGVLAALVLWLLPIGDIGPIRHIADGNADRMTRMANYTTGTIDPAAEMAFFDIDDTTWYDWGGPVILPRDKLTGLLAAAVRSKARAIVLDVDLAYPDVAEREKFLGNFIESYPTGAPPLLLMRSLVPPSPGTKVLYPSARTTAFDAAVASAQSRGGQVSWATPLFERDGDGTIRRWRLYETVCEGTSPRILPSIALAAAELIRRPPLKEAKKSAGEASGKPGHQPLTAQLEPLLPRDCTTWADKKKSVRLAVEDGRRPIVLDDRDPGQRVIYRIDWAPNAPALGPTVTGVTPPQLMVVRSARAVLASGHDGAVPAIAGRVVIVGGSFKSGGDIHETPVGQMPGALVIANAIHALAYSGTPRAPSLWLNALITTIVLLMASAATTVFRPAIAAIVSLVGGIAVMFAVLPLFRSGVVFALVVPALATLFHDSIASFSKLAWSLLEERWRWLLNPELKQKLKDPGQESPPP